MNSDQFIENRVKFNILQPYISISRFIIIDLDLVSFITQKIILAIFRHIETPFHKSLFMC